MTMPPESNSYLRIPELDRSPVLSMNEGMASWRRNSRGALYIFSTSSGELLVDTDDRHHAKSALLPSVAPSFHTEGFWATIGDHTSLIIYDEATGTFLDCKEWCVINGCQRDPSLTTFDGDRSVFFRTLHDLVDFDTRVMGTTNHFAHLTISPNEFDPNSPEGTVAVTLPGRSKTDGRRRQLELELPWVLEEGDFFGMMNDYLIYSSPRSGFLVLVDFWPVW